MPTRRAVVTWLAALDLLLAVVLVGFLAPAPRTRHVPVPADGATAVQVVTAFVDALSSHDCATAARLSTARARPETASWCRDLAAVEHLRVLGDPTPDGPGRVDVGVDVDLRWRPLHDDGLSPGTGTSWGSVLRRSPSGAWRVDDQGVA